MRVTKSSFPDIFKDNPKENLKIQKQEKQFSLYLRSNSFDFNQANQDTRLNNITSRKRANRSLNEIYNKDNFIDQNQTKSTFRLTSRKSFSKTYFIQQKQTQNAQQMNSFKNVRKNVVQQIVLAHKTLQVISQSEKKVQEDLKSVKQKYLDSLVQLNINFLNKIQQLDKSIKKCRRQTGNEQKVNKKLCQYLKQEFQVSKSIFTNFQIEEEKFRYQLTNN